MVFCEEPFGDGLVEHYVDIVGVTGSIPVPPTTQYPQFNSEFDFDAVAVLNRGWLGSSQGHLLRQKQTLMPPCRRDFGIAR